MAHFIPVSELSSYRSGWTIKARVLSRSSTRTFNRQTGSGGKVFDVLLTDVKGAEIRASFWDQAVEKFDFLKEGGVYTFSRGQCKLANKKFNNTKHNYELSFAGDAVVGAVEDDVDFAGFQEAFQFVELRELRALPVPATVDLCVMVKSMLLPKEIQGGKRWLRRLTCVDKSEHSMDISVFDEERPEQDLVDKCVVFKRCKIGDYRGRDGTTNGKELKVEPDMPEATQLKAWWAAEGKSATVHALSTENRTGGTGDLPTHEGTFEDLAALSSKLQVDQTVFFNTHAYLSRVKTHYREEKKPLTYDACPNCLKKVLPSDECIKCGKTVQPVPRFLIGSLQFEDKHSAQWASCFDAASNILGLEAKEVKAMADSPDLNQKLNERCFGALFKLNMKTQAQVYEGQVRNKTTVISAEPANYTDLGQKLLAQLAEMYGGLDAKCQAEVQELLTGPSSLKAMEGGFPDAWATDFTKLQAVVA